MFQLILRKLANTSDQAASVLMEETYEHLNPLLLLTGSPILITARLWYLHSVNRVGRSGCVLLMKKIDLNIARTITKLMFERN